MTGALFPLSFERGAMGAKVPLHNSVMGNFRDAGERENDEGISPWPFKRGQEGRRCPS